MLRSGGCRRGAAVSAGAAFAGAGCWAGRRREDARALHAMAPAEGFAAEGSQGPERLQGEVCGCFGKGFHGRSREFSFFEGPSRVRAAGPAVGERMCVRRMRWPRPRGLRRKGRKVRNVCRVRFAAEGVSDVVPAIPPPIAGASDRVCGAVAIRMLRMFRAEKVSVRGGVSPDTGASSAVSGPRGGVLSCPACGRANRPAERKRFMLDLRPGRRMKMRRERPAAGGGGRRGCRAALLPPALLSDSVRKPARRLRLSRAGRPK